jgi:hypothetical protein
MAEQASQGSMMFAIVIFTVATVIGVVIAWLGITGRIGGPIP